MINHEQIRAARAILDWSTADLAKVTGLTVNGLNKIERGHVGPQKNSLEKIQAAFEKAGIEFLPDSGVRRKNNIIFVDESEDCVFKMLTDSYEVLLNTGEEILIAHLNDAAIIEHLGTEVFMNFIRKRRAAGITGRYLVKENDPGITPPYHEYRIIPDNLFSTYPFFIYGPKVVLISWKPSLCTIFINDARFAESARKLFELAWLNAKHLER